MFKSHDSFQSVYDLGLTLYILTEVVVTPLSSLLMYNHIKIPYNKLKGSGVTPK